MSDDRYNIRWKGKTFGPFSRREIERKIQEQEFGTLHEVWSDGQWITLKEFLGPRKPVLSPTVPVSVRATPARASGHDSEEPAEESTPAPEPPSVWVMTGYITGIVLLFLALIGWAGIWTVPSGWAPLVGLGLGLAGALFGLLAWFQGERKHGTAIVACCVLLAFANMVLP